MKRCLVVYEVSTTTFHCCKLLISMELKFIESIRTEAKSGSAVSLLLRLAIKPNRRDRQLDVSEIEAFGFMDETAERPRMGLQRAERLLTCKPTAGDLLH